MAEVWVAFPERRDPRSQASRSWSLRRAGSVCSGGLAVSGPQAACGGSMAAIPWLVVRDKEKEGQEEEPGFVTEEGAPRIDTKASAEGAQPVMGARISLHLRVSSLK